MNKRLIYILPEASEKTHMQYNVEFITALAREKNVDIFLILERGFTKENSLNLKNYLENIKEKTSVKFIFYTGTNIFTRIPKLLSYLLYANLKGYKKVYIHYSFIGAIFASLNPFFTTYYWNCGIPWQYKRPLLQETYESLAYKLVSNFVTGASALTKNYSSFYKFNIKKSIVIPNWIDVTKTLKIKNNQDKQNLKGQLKLNDSEVILFFNQRLSERKGAQYILPILRATPENVKIIITNDGPYKEKLLAELKEYKLENRVRILGRVPNEKVIQLMSITDIYILPSDEEGMSHSLLEAMCCAVPAVSFDVGGTRDMYPDNFKEYCVEEKNISKYIEKLQELLLDPGKRLLLGNALFEQVKNYDLSIVLEKFKSDILK